MVVLILALLPVVNTLLLVVMAWLGRKKLLEIHVLVNSRLQATLEHLDLLKAELAKHQ